MTTSDRLPPPPRRPAEGLDAWCPECEPFDCDAHGEDEMNWIVPPAAQGQAVEYSYASDGETCYMEVTDRSDGTVERFKAPWDRFKRRWDPVNEEPAEPTGGWQRVEAWKEGGW